MYPHQPLPWHAMSQTTKIRYKIQSTEHENQNTKLGHLSTPARGTLTVESISVTSATCLFVVDNGHWTMLTILAVFFAFNFIYVNE